MTDESRDQLKLLLPLSDFFPVPVGLALFHAMDDANFRIALRYNERHLRVVSLDESDWLSGMYFSSGLDSNQLAPGSNPIHIAGLINDGSYDNATRSGIVGFV